MFALVAGLLVVVAAPAQADPPSPGLPGGKKNWVVSVGGIDTKAGNDYHNWVRLGYYEFHTDGTVATHYWKWNQRDEPVRKNAMTADCGGDVPTCPIRTVAGYEDGSAGPPGGFQGRFQVVGSGLTVTWEKKADGTPMQDLVEHWSIDTGLAGGNAARIKSPTFYGEYVTEGVDVPTPSSAVPFSDYGATFGVGYGSNAGLDSGTRASMSDLLTDPGYSAQRYRGAFVVGNKGVVSRQGAGGDWTFGGVAGDNPMDPWKRCRGAACIGYLQPGASVCPKNGPPDWDRVRYIGEVGGGRRNIEEYWCQNLARNGDCYAYNSHPRPMLQVIDDAGRFQGWVGVEAFTHVRTAGVQDPDESWAEGYWGVFDMVSIDRMQPDITPSAVNPFSKFRVSYGNSYAEGALRWYPGQVSFMGANVVESGCRYAEAVMFMPDGSRQRQTSSRYCTVTDPDSDRRVFDQKVTFPEGSPPARVQITYWQADTVNGPYATAGTVECTRVGGTCTATTRDPGPVKTFRLTYGSSVATGAISWFERSASFEGVNHVVSGCRFVELVSTAADNTSKRNTTSPFCGTDADHPFGPTKIEFPGVQGGIVEIAVTYWISEDGGDTYATKGTQSCTRSGCVNDRTARDAVTEFRLAYGQSVATGRLTWVNRSVVFEGNNHAVSGCRYVRLIATGADGSRQTASSTDFCSFGDRSFGPQTISFSQVDGGASRVVVEYHVNDGTGEAVKDTVTCTRTEGCA
ncbi:hypothetical protein [Streptomyces sp. NPDC101166]|uniref:hypothetical protein n=1 Tax=Streptomyces sp. NPDC101166 TaxID=3366120 RepID=UPI003824D583